MSETISELRRSSIISWLLPDSYIQVVMEYEILKNEQNKLKPKRIAHIAIEVQHMLTVTIDDIHKHIKE
jgi:S-adenosylmethionine synthetase